MLDWSHGTAWETTLSALRLFRYITVRSAGAAITALVLSWWLGPKIIHWLKQLKFGQEYADKAEEAGGLAARVLSKKGTPTMGGILIVAVLVFSTMLWAQWNAQVELTLLSVLVLAGLGFYDDYAKIIQQSGGGTPPRVKLMVQIALAAVRRRLSVDCPPCDCSCRNWFHSNLVTWLPFYKYPVAVGAAWSALLVVVLAIVGSSNAVNLTDGLDGLAIGCTLIVAFVFLGVHLRGGQRQGGGLSADSLRARRGRIDGVLRGADRRGPGIFVVQLPSGAGVHGRHRLARAGRRVWHHGGADSPAVRAGDCRRRVCDGSRVGDAANRLVSVHADAYGTGRRIFLMAPLHHHFEKKGWYESQVVMRFYILCVLFAVVALATLKLR